MQNKKKPTQTHSVVRTWSILKPTDALLLVSLLIQNVFGSDLAPNNISVVNLANPEIQAVSEEEAMDGYFYLPPHLGEQFFAKINRNIHELIGDEL